MTDDGFIFVVKEQTCFMRKKVFYRIHILLICVFSFLSSFAQEKVISGTVVDEKGVTLPGATIAIRNSKISTRTNAEGKFSIEVPSDTGDVDETMYIDDLIFVK